MLHDFKSVIEKTSVELRTLLALLSESMPPEMRKIVRADCHKEAVICALEYENPGLAAHVTRLATSGEGDVALDMIAERLEALREIDSPLFEKLPSREEMLCLCIEHFGATPTADQRTHMWTAFCGTDEVPRFRIAHQFRHEIARRAQKKTVHVEASAQPDRAGRISGGLAARARVENAIEEASVAELNEVAE